MEYLRNRDYAATVIAVILARLTYTYSNGPESFSISTSLAFYSEFKAYSKIYDTDVNDGHVISLGRIHTAKPVPFDMDGDGIVEALVVPALLVDDNDTKEEEDDNDNVKKQYWGLKILDLEPMHNKKSRKKKPAPTSSNYYEKMMMGVPFYPETTYVTKPTTIATNYTYDDEDDEITAMKIPIFIKTGHISFVKKEKHNNKASSTTKRETSFVTTPKKTLPSIITVWSDGSISLHSITADLNVENGKQGNTDNNDWYKTRNHDMSSSLELREMWRINPIADLYYSQSNQGEDHQTASTTSSSSSTMQSSRKAIEFKELDIIMDSNLSLGQFGAVIVAASYQNPSLMNGPTTSNTNIVTSYFALDALTGKSIWTKDNKSNIEETKNDEEINSTSATTTPSKEHFNSAFSPPGEEIKHDDINSSPEECMDNYRHWVLNPSSQALPRSYWDDRYDEKGVISDYTKLSLSQLDWRRQTMKSSLGTTTSKDDFETKDHDDNNKERTHQNRDQQHPNVALFQNLQGLHVISLESGRKICQVSLPQSGLYLDINNDGTIDHLQVVTDDWKPVHQKSYSFDTLSEQHNDKSYYTSDELTRNLMRRVQESTIHGSDDKRELCHALLLSGIPAREELFNVPLCNGIRSTTSENTSGIYAATPLLVEGMTFRGRHTHEIIFALSTGIVTRYDHNGNQQWTTSSKKFSSHLPHWDREHVDNGSAGFLGRVDVGNLPLQYLSARPILVSGSNGMAILSAEQGRMLAHTDFPQLAVGKPILADMSGDGTTDVLIVSAGALWGYKIHVQTGGATLAYFFLFLLTIGLVMAVMAQKKIIDTIGKSRRSTDIHE